MNGNVLDVYVDSSAPNTNFGAVPNMFVGDGPGGSSQRLAFRFDVSSIPASAVVTYARLGITSPSQTGVLMLGAYEQAAASKITATHATLGANGSLLGAAFQNTGPGPQGQGPIFFSSAGLASLVQGWVNGTKPAKTIVIAKVSGSGQTTLPERRAPAGQRLSSPHGMLHELACRAPSSGARPRGRRAIPPAARALRPDRQPRGAVASRRHFFCDVRRAGAPGFAFRSGQPPWSAEASAAFEPEAGGFVSGGGRGLSARIAGGSGGVLAARGLRGARARGGPSG